MKKPDISVKGRRGRETISGGDVTDKIVSIVNSTACVGLSIGDVGLSGACVTVRIGSVVNSVADDEL